jgi:hypothetical protein
MSLLLLLAGVSGEPPPAPGPPEPAVPDAPFFNGITRPRIQVLAGFGGTLDPGAGYLHLGVGPGLGTGMLGGPGVGVNEVDITPSVRSVSLSQRGPTSDIDAADPVTCALVLNNADGAFDPGNPASPYWGPNRLTGQQQSLEDGSTTGWQVGGSCTISSSAAQAHAGSRTLALTSTSGSGGIWANTLTGTDAMPWAAGDPIQATAWFRSATRSVTALIAVMFWDAAGNFVDQTNGTGVATSTSAWTQGTVTTVAPTGTAYASIQVLYASVIAIGEVHYADDLAVQGTGMADGTPIRVRWIWADAAYNRFYGELASVRHSIGNDGDVTATMVAYDGQEKLGRAYLPATSPTHDSVLTGTRVAYLLDQAVYPSALRAIDLGYATLGPTTLGASAQELLRKVESTELGLIFVDGGGRLVFYERHRGATSSRSTTVQATFGDTAGSIPLFDLDTDLDRSQTFNRAAGTRDPAPDDPVGRPGEWSDATPDEPVEQVADDPVSQGVKGVLAFPTDVGQLLRNDSEMLAELQYIVARYKSTQGRIPGLNVSTLSTPTSLYATLLSLGPWDRIQVDQGYGSVTIATELLIQGMTEEIVADPPAWSLNFTTSPPPPTPTLFRLGTAQLGSSTTGRLGW